MMSKEEILEDECSGSGQFIDTTKVDAYRESVDNAMESYAEEVAIDYAHWLLERIFSTIMQGPDREGRKLFDKYQQEKNS